MNLKEELKKASYKVGCGLPCNCGQKVIALSELKKIIMDNSDDENVFNEIVWAIEEIEKQDFTKQEGKQ